MNRKGAEMLRQTIQNECPEVTATEGFTARTGGFVCVTYQGATVKFTTPTQYQTWREATFPGRYAEILARLAAMPLVTDL